MGKIAYDDIRWNARTNWEFWNGANNILEAYRRSPVYDGRPTLAVFGYREPDAVAAFAVGDVVVYRAKGSQHDGKFAAVYKISLDTDLVSLKMWIKFANGETIGVRHSDIVKGTVAPAEIPDELVALARAEAGKPIDFSKCPLKKPGACMEA